MPSILKLKKVVLSLKYVQDLIKKVQRLGHVPVHLIAFIVSKISDT